ncbi:hypothetical protein BV898_16210 [Hypsibius exemplaris]|uniref:Uncharacterized protein n=1 Tax=Hypsibius exemplaris TaxID=2072580 RepID=A0A9X6RL26_HYPEX|nr:hypothetical protein BV898_16210 [Hypsibius exemplaris]
MGDAVKGLLQIQEGNSGDLALVYGQAPFFGDFKDDCLTRESSPEAGLVSGEDFIVVQRLNYLNLGGTLEDGNDCCEPEDRRKSV